jgi:hypothetical protein
MASRILIACFALATVYVSCAPVIAPSPSNQTQSVNVTASNVEIIVNQDGLLSYGSPGALDRVLILPASVIELDKKGNPVSTIEGEHYFSSLNTTVWNISSPFTTDIEGVAAKGVNFTTTLENNAKLLLSALLITEDGVISTEEDQVNVTAGSLKVNVGVDKWGWCKKKAKHCRARGEFLQVDLALRGLIDTISLIANTTWSLGEDVLLWLDPNGLFDNHIVNSIADGYPTIVRANTTTPVLPSLDGSNSTEVDFIRVRFPRFGNTPALWDCLIL